MTAPGEIGHPVPVSVLICSRDRPDLLADTVRSVLDGSRLPAELLIVDQSAEPHSELAELSEVGPCRVRYLHSSTTGLSRARNLGIRSAEQEVVVLIDDDMFVDEEWLSELLTDMPRNAAAVATGRVLAAPPEGTGGALPPAALVQRDIPATYRGPQPLDVVPGANVAVPRELVLALGGYDERLGAGTRFNAADDNDMGYRLLLAGCDVHHIPSAIVRHRAWRPRSELVRLRWRYGRGKGAFYAKHARLRDPHILQRAAADVARRLRRAGTTLVRSPRTAAAEVISLAGMAAGAADWVITQRIPGWLRGRVA